MSSIRELTGCSRSGINEEAWVNPNQIYKEEEESEGGNHPPMERLFRVPCGYGTTDPLTYPGPWRHCQQQNWPQNMGAPIFLARPRVPANVSQSCMDPYNRAQLQAVSTQMDPNLSLWLRRVHTKEVGVQVSLRVDKSVQCSLGSQTLHSSSLSDRTSSRKPTEAWEVGRRALIRRPQDGEDEESQELTGPREANKLLPPTWRPDSEEQFPRLKELGKEYAPSPQDRKGKQVCASERRARLGSSALSWLLSAQPPHQQGPPSFHFQIGKC